MGGEGADLELKISFDKDHPGSMLKLIKELVAMANSGGGTIRIGVSETESPGVDQGLVDFLDSSRVSDEINRFITPAKVSLSHSVEQLESGSVIIDLIVDGAVKYPYVFEKDGQYTLKKTTSVFRAGDVYVRRGSDCIRASYYDLMDIIDQAEERGRRQYLDRLQEVFEKMVRLPEGSTPIVIATTPTGGIEGTSNAVIDFVIGLRQSGDNGAVLDGDTLLRCFLDRENIELTDARLELLIRSALRRTPTLYYWLSNTRNSEFVESILQSTLLDTDRDKSDAAKNILEVASIYAEDDMLEQILKTMSDSTYRHFQSAVEGWSNRDQSLNNFRFLVQSVCIEESPAIELSEHELLEQIIGLAERILERPSPHLSYRMANIGKVILYQSICENIQDFPEWVRVLTSEQAISIDVETS